MVNSVEVVMVVVVMVMVIGVYFQLVVLFLCFAFHLFVDSIKLIVFSLLEKDIK